MKHKSGFNALNMKSGRRKAVKRSMVTSVFKYERIKTTKARALEIRRMAEKMITRAKADSVHNRRIVAEDIKDEAVLAKLFTDIAPRYATRNGGYTRILKLGRRNNDAAEIVLLELIDRKIKEKKSKKDKDNKAVDVKASEKETNAPVEKAETPAKVAKAPAKRAKAPTVKPKATKIPAAKPVRTPAAKKTRTSSKEA